MTKKFKNTVRAIVLDGVITPEERKILERVAKEENVSASDAEIYIAQELKKRIVKLKNPGGNWFSRNSPALLAGVFTIGGVFVKSLMEARKLK